MSVPKIVKILSLQKKKSLKDEKHSFQIQDKSTIQTVILAPNSGSSSNESVLVSQIKKLSKDNDRLWKLLTQNTDNHNQCTKVQKKLKQNLQCVQKQASLIKQMYDVQKTNHQQSKVFYQKRQRQWQSIVSELKKVIEDYQTTSQLDIGRASQIFNQTTQLKNPLRFQNKNQKITKQKIHDSQYYMNQLDNRQVLCSQKKAEEKIKNQDAQRLQSEIKQSQIQYNKDSDVRQKSCLSIRSKNHRDKWFKNYNFRQNSSSSSKRLFQNLYKKQLPNIEVHRASLNPQIRYDFLNNQDLFDYALRRTYIKFREEGSRALEIMNNQHFQKLKTANSSTKQRLNKTIRKVFVLNNQQQFQDIIQYIQEKVHRKHKVIKGQFIYQFLQQKFLECEQLIESSNSALDRLDKQPSNMINGASMNSRFRIFQQKKKEIRSLQKFQGSKNSFRQSTPLNTLKDYDQKSSISSKSNNFQLNINSNIKSGKNALYYHQNNHMNNSEYEDNQYKKNKEKERDNSKKNIYTQKQIAKNQFLSTSRYQTEKKIDTSRQGSKLQNLSSLIGGTNFLNEYQVVYRSKQKDERSGGNKTADTTIKY